MNGQCHPFRLLGVGSPMVDYSAHVSDKFLASLPGGKGGTLHISRREIDAIIAALPVPPLVVSGGASGNTVTALAECGVDAALFGKLGHDDDGARFRTDLLRAGASDAELLTSGEDGTACCLSLVTPDAERTMRSTLGASALLREEDFSDRDFSRYTWVLTEGYMLDCPVFPALLEHLKSCGCRIAFDLSSFEIASQYHDTLHKILPQYVSLLLANEEEAAALCGISDPQENCRRLANLCGMAVVKCGAQGAFAAKGDELVTIAPVSFGKAVDTTAAGDHFAAGFFFGLAHDLSLAQCGQCGALLGAAATTVKGAKLPAEMWNELRKRLDLILKTRRNGR